MVLGSSNLKSKGKVFVGMSGGVDSSVALLLLKKEGYDPIGVSLKYSVWDNKCNFKENVCCSAKSFKVAQDICKRLDVPYYKINVEKITMRQNAWGFLYLTLRQCAHKKCFHLVQVKNNLM